MDCEQIRELLDGYALGASGSEESRQIEVHIADCVRCWEDLSVSQATAALLALSVRLETPPAKLEHAIMRQAERDLSIRPDRLSLWRRLRLSPWPAAASAFGAVSIVALVVSGMLFFEVRDMQSKNDTLEIQILNAASDFQEASESTSSQLADQEQVVAILSDGDHGQLEMTARGGSVSQAFYTWSETKRMGAMLCEGLPELEPNKVYMTWLKVGEEEYPLRPFISDDGKCQVIIDLGALNEVPDGIGITIEDAPGSTTTPTKPWFMYGHFPG